MQDLSTDMQKPTGYLIRHLYVWIRRRVAWDRGPGPVDQSWVILHRFYPMYAIRSW